MRSDRFEKWLSHVWYRKTGIALPTQTLEEVKRTLDVKAYTEGPKYQPFVRVGERNGRLYLDLCDERWRAVEIGSNGWAVIDCPPVKFLRAASARSLPEPEHGNMIEVLRRFVNVVNEDEFRLIVAWLVAAAEAWLSIPDSHRQWHARERQKRAVPIAAVADRPRHGTGLCRTQG